MFNLIRSRGFRSTFATSLLSIAVVTSSHAQTESDSLRVGIYHNPPKLLLDEGGRPSGIFGDLLTAIAEREGWTLEPVPCLWQTCLDQLGDGRIDLLPDLAWNPTRAEEFDFHERPMLHSWSQIYQAGENTLDSMLDLDRKRLAVPVGAIQRDYLDNLAENFGIEIVFVEVESFEEGFKAAQQGDADAAVANRHFGEWQATRFGLRETSLIFQPAALFVATSLGRYPEVLDAIDRSIIEWKASPDSLYYTVLKKWQIESPASRFIPPILIWSLALAIALLMAVLGFNWLLRRRVARRTAQLKASEDKLATILDSVEACIFIKSPDLRYTYVNRKVCDFFGLSEEDIIGRRDEDLFDADTALELQAMDRTIIEKHEALTREEQNTRAGDSKTYTFLSIKLPLFNPDGTLQSLCGISTDITDFREVLSHNHQLAYYDGLTGLPNRRLLLDRLTVAVKTSHRSGGLIALMFIDLDHFRVINDALGPSEGDRLLNEVSMALLDLTAEGDTLARLGGDEFVLLVQNLDKTLHQAALDVERIGDRLLASLPALHDRDPTLPRVTGSIGITLSSREAKVDALLQQADIALNRAKAEGGNGLRFFEAAMQNEIMARLNMENDLRLALMRDQLSLHYQPQVDMRGRMTGVEALLRWSHPTHGMISPGIFIPIAEESRLILPIGRWVLETACRQLALWADDPGRKNLTIAVNVSAVQFRQPDFVDQVREILSTSGADPARLELEVTESLLMEDPEAMREIMMTLQALGVSFALDDFGTGYSSLGYLKRLPLEKLKIDGSFIRDVLDDTADAAIVRATILLADSLGLTVMAEGVELQEQKEWLASQGCSAYQGFLFSRPLPVDDLPAA